MFRFCNTLTTKQILPALSKHQNWVLSPSESDFLRLAWPNGIAVATVNPNDFNDSLEETQEPSMPNTTTKQKALSSDFYNRHMADILIVTIGALAIIVFLSSAFYLYDANKVEGPNPELQQIETQAGPDDLVAASCDKLFLGCVAVIHDVAGWSSNVATASMKLTAVVSPDNKTMWRYTANGWQDISLVAEQSQPTQPFLEGVHPLVWTAITLFGVLILLVMASSESEVDKLIYKQPVASNQKNQAT